MGYIMTKDQTRTYDKKIMAAAVVAFICQLLFVFINSANMNYVYNKYHYAAVALLWYLCTDASP